MELTPAEQDKIRLWQTHPTGRDLIPIIERLMVGTRGIADSNGQFPNDYEDLGRSFFEAYNDAVKNEPDFICADSPVEILAHLQNARDEAVEKLKFATTEMTSMVHVDENDLPPGVAALSAENDALRAKQRTPGMVEICQHYRTASCGENEDHNNMGVCGRKNCPIKAARTEVKL